MKRIVSLLVAAVVSMVICRSHAGGPDLKMLVSTDCATVVSSTYQMMYDSEANIVYVFAPKNEKVNVSVTPLSGWSWNYDKYNADTSTKRIELKGEETVKKNLYGTNGEGKSAVTIQKREVMAYVRIRPYLGLDMENSGDEKIFKANNRWYTAEVSVVPGSDFKVNDKDPCTWTINKVELEEAQKNEMIVPFALTKKYSTREKIEKASVTVKGEYNGKKKTLEGSANFTIVKVDVCLKGKTEKTEDEPGYECEKSGAEPKATVTFSCQPAVMSGAAKNISIDGARLLEQYYEKSFKRYREVRDISLEKLNAKTYYLDTSKAEAGNIRICHPASGAIDSAKYLCWALEFIKPSGSPVTQPEAGVNEFCYDDDTRKCAIDLEVGMYPRAGKGLTLDKIRKQYAGWKFSVDSIKESGVFLEWDESLGGESGKWEENNGIFVCRAKAYYRGMPKSSTSFGGKKAFFSNGARKLDAKFEVFFPKNGHGHPACAKCAGCPNWFYYWSQGAVPGLNAANVKFRDMSSECGKMEWDGSNGNIFVSKLAAEHDQDYEIRKFDRTRLVPNANGLYVGDPNALVEGSAVKVGLESAYEGVAFAAAVVLHEQRHLDIAKESNGKVDTDDDNVADRCESRFGLITYIDMASSYNFLQVASAEQAAKYRTYADNEIRALLAEKDAKNNAYNIALDWAKPGCQTEIVCGPPECPRRK